jgi:hypothetical protein
MFEEKRKKTGKLLFSWFMKFRSTRKNQFSAPHIYTHPVPSVVALKRYRMA